MRKSILIAAATFALVRAASAKTESMVLRMVDNHGLLRESVQSKTASMVEDLFEGIGVSARWAASSDELRIPERGQAELLVLIRRVRPEELGLEKNVMGATSKRRTPMKILFIFMPAVTHAIDVKLGGMPRFEEERLLAIALSRVIVHEAFHAIAPELDHAKDGLTRARLTRDLLTKRDAKIAPSAAARFRSELALISRLP